MSASESELALARQLQELSETVAVLKDALGNRLRVTLRALNDRTYLGQSVGVVAKVTDLLTGEPRADVPVTFASTWGRLESVAGYVLEKGNTLTELTDGDGLVTVTMVPPLFEELTPERKAAVETLLQTFDPEATAPQQVRPRLQEMVTQYRWEANASFRESVDLFFQEFRPHLRETVGLRDRMLRWSYFESTVVAYAQGNDAADVAAATSVLSSAVLNLRFKDWLGPFLQTYVELADDEDSLGNNLNNSKSGTQDGSELLGNFYGHIRDYVVNERGFVGSHVGSRVAADSLQKFISNGLGDLPLGTRISVAEGLKVASGTIATAGVSVLEGFARAGTELRQELNTQLSGEAGSALSGIRQSIQTEAGNSLETFKNQLGGLRAGSLQGHQAELGGLRTGNLDGFRKDITGIRADTLNGFQTEAGNVRTGVLQGLKNDAGAFRDSTLTGFRNDVGTFRETTFKAFQADVDRTKLNSANAFNADIGNVRTGTLQGFQNDLAGLRDATLKGFQNDAGATRAGTLQGLQGDITKARGDSLAGFQRDISGDVTTRLQGFQNDLNTLKDNSFKNFQTNVGAAQANAVQSFSSALMQTRIGHIQGFQQDASSVRDTIFKGLQADVGNVRAATMTTFQKDAGDLKTNLLQAFQNDATGVRTSILQDIQKSAVIVKDSTVKTFQAEVANVRTDTLRAFQTDVTNVKTATVQLASSEIDAQRKAHVKGFSSDLTGARAASLQEFQGNIQAEANNNLISTRMNRLENSVTSAHTNIANIQLKTRQP